MARQAPRKGVGRFERRGEMLAHHSYKSGNRFRHRFVSGLLRLSFGGRMSDRRVIKAYLIGVLIVLLFWLVFLFGWVIPNNRNPEPPTTPSSPTPTQTVFPPPAKEEPHDHGSHDHSHNHAPGVSDTHRVIKGDTLWDIAEDHLGDPQKWRQIYKLNKDQIENPHWIFPGQVFVLN